MTVAEVETQRATADFEHRPILWQALLPARTRLNWLGLDANAAALISRVVTPFAQVDDNRPAANAIAAVGLALDDIDPEALACADSLVGLNPRRWSAQALKRAGFAHVLRFFAVGNPITPVLLLPTERRGLVGASRLYVPNRPRAKVAAFLARRVGQIGAGPLLLKPVWIASRTQSPLASAIAADLPGSAQFGLYNGRGKPGTTRRVSISVMDDGGAVIAYGKLGQSKFAYDRVVREAEVLLTLAERSTPTRCPEVAFAGAVQNMYLLLSTPLCGEPPPPEMNSATFGFLDTLRTTKRRTVGTCRYTRKLRRRLDAFTQNGAAEHRLPVLEQSFADLQELLKDLVVSSCVVHRDFAPWNLRTCAGTVHAFDWETAELEGPPHVDACYFVSTVAMLLKRLTPRETMVELNALATTVHKRDATLSIEQLYQLQTLSVLDRLMDLMEEGHEPGSSEVGWWVDLLNACMARLRR